MMLLRRFFIFYCVFSISTASAEPRVEIVFACHAHSGSPIFHLLEDVYRSAFEEVGYKFSMRHMTEKRVISELKSHKIDGGCGVRDLSWLDGDDKSYMLLEAISEINFILISSPEFPAIPSSSDPKLKSMRVGSLRGSPIVKYLEQSGLENNIQLTSISSAWKMLMANRLDAVATLDIVFEAE